MKTFRVEITLNRTKERAFAAAIESGNRVQPTVERHWMDVPAIRGFFTDQCLDTCDHGDKTPFHFRLHSQFRKDYWLDVGVTPTFDDLFCSLDFIGHQYGSLWAACAEYALGRGHVRG